MNIFLGFSCVYCVCVCVCVRVFFFCLIRTESMIFDTEGLETIDLDLIRRLDTDKQTLSSFLVPQRVITMILVIILT